MASTYLTKTFGSAGNRKTWTWSAWVKKSAPTTSYQRLFLGEVDGNNSTAILFDVGGDDLRLYSFDSGVTTIQLKLSAKLRDVSAWYHIVVTADTTQATASDRVKFYVNGVQETSLSETTYPSLNYQFYINSNVYHNIASNSGASQAFNGSMAHIHFIDGTAYSPSDFGETDATTGIWKPITEPSVTYGTNGFFLKFENSGAFGTDSSGNSNNFTVNGTMTQTIDTPSNVFATLNGVFNKGYGSLSNGNTTNTNSDASNWNSVPATLGASSGKYYCEAKLTDSTYHMHGVGDMEYLVAVGQNGLTNIGFANGGVGVYSADGQKYVEGTNSNFGVSYGDTDIFQIALDMDNGYVYFGKNGTWMNSGDPTSGASGTGGIALPHTNATYTFCFSNYGGGTANVNFGNGYFGTTAVSSAQNPDDGIGIFEYAVPTGYKALCTKSINAQEYD